MRETREESYSLRGRLTNQMVGGVTNSGIRYFDGNLLFEEGMVGVMVEQPSVGRFVNGFTRFDAVVNGRHHMHTEYRALTRRGVIAVARRWLRSLSGPRHD